MKSYPNSVELHTNRMGEGSPPLIITHGIFGMADNWATVAKSLSTKYKVILTDLRNHGRSPHTPTQSYGEMAEDLARVADSLVGEKPILIGHSMGGKAAMNAVALFPHLFQGLIVVDIGPKYYPIYHHTILEGLNSIDFKKVTTRGEVDAQLSKYIPEPDVRLFLMKNLHRTEEGSFSWRLNLPLVTQSIAAVGEALNPDWEKDTPTLFIKGGQSKYILNEDWAAITKQFPNSTLEAVEKAGHWVHADSPNETIALITQWVERL